MSIINGKFYFFFFSTMNNSNKVKDVLILGVFLFLVIGLSPFIFIGAGIYLAYRICRMINQKKLLKQIREEWFPKGKYIFFLYSDSKKWKDYFENELVPKIQGKASVWNWSTRQKDGWNDDIIEAKILKPYKLLGYFYPMAIVFLPSGEVKTFQFYTPYVNMLKSGKDEYNKMEKEFLALADSFENKEKIKFSKKRNK